MVAHVPKITRDSTQKGTPGVLFNPAWSEAGAASFLKQEEAGRLDAFALCQRTGVWIPALISGPSQISVTPAPRDLIHPSDICGYLTHAYVEACMHPHTNKIKNRAVGHGGTHFNPSTRLAEAVRLP